MTKLISEMSFREIRAERIQSRRRRNAMARSMGFRNYAQMTGDDVRETEDDR